MKDCSSTFKLGLCYTFGHDVPVNNDKAISLLQEAASEGSGEAIFELGTLKLHGKILPTNHKEAVKLLLKADGVFRGEGQLVLCYENGIELKRDSKTALQLLSKAFDGGDFM